MENKIFNNPITFATYSAYWCRTMHRPVISGTVWLGEENTSSKESFLGVSRRYCSLILFVYFDCAGSLGLAGSSLVVVCGLLLAVASLDMEHRL